MTQEDVSKVPISSKLIKYTDRSTIMITPEFALYTNTAGSSKWIHTGDEEGIAGIGSSDTVVDARMSRPQSFLLKALRDAESLNEVDLGVGGVASMGGPSPQRAGVRLDRKAPPSFGEDQRVRAGRSVHRPELPSATRLEHENTRNSPRESIFRVTDCARVGSSGQCTLLGWCYSFCRTRGSEKLECQRCAARWE